MIKNIISLLLLLLSTEIYSASFPYKTVISESVTTGPMTEITTSTYSSFDGDVNTMISAEWSTQKTPAGKKRTFNLTKNGFVYAVDLDTKHCTKTDIKAMMNAISDPEAMSKDMKRQMGLKENGTCEGAGYKGIKYSSQFGEMCFYKDVFLLWQKVMGTQTKVTRVEFDVDLPKDKITLPAGIKCVEGPDISQGLRGLQSYRGSDSPDAASGSSQQEAPQNAPQNMDDAMKMFKDMFGK